MTQPNKFLKLRTSALMTGMLLLWAHSATQGHAAPPPRRIEVVAKRFTYEPAEITVKKGEPVILVFTTTDVAHGLAFTDLPLKTDIEKGGATELAWTPDQTGDFVGHCSHFCGSGHGAMTLTLHVTE